MSDKKQPIDSQVHFEIEPEINKYFKVAIKSHATDLHLKVGQPPKLRIGEDIKSTTADALTEDKIEKLVFEILTEKQKHFFLENGTLDGVIRGCQKEGMQDFTESLRLLVEGDWIDMKVALQNAPNVEELKMALKGIRATAGAII